MAAQKAIKTRKKPVKKVVSKKTSTKKAVTKKVVKPKKFLKPSLLLVLQIINLKLLLILVKNSKKFEGSRKPSKKFPQYVKVGILLIGVNLILSGFLKLNPWGIILNFSSNLLS